MSTAPLHLAIVVGSTRQGRFGDTVARWFAGHARHRSDWAVDLVDLADVEVPPAFPRRPSPDVERFLGRLDRADAFVIVTPEYNHGYPASLKQAIDLAGEEWHAKPVGFVSYGGASGGIRAVEQLRPVFAELHAVTVRNAVSFPWAHNSFDESGRPRESDRYERAAERLLGQLAWWARALRDARTARPYAA